MCLLKGVLRGFVGVMCDVGSYAIVVADLAAVVADLAVLPIYIQNSL